VLSTRGLSAFFATIDSSTSTIINEKNLICLIFEGGIQCFLCYESLNYRNSETNLSVNNSIIVRLGMCTTLIQIFMVSSAGISHNKVVRLDQDLNDLLSPSTIPPCVIIHFNYMHAACPITRFMYTHNTARGS
jgi:hypothetical protein